MVAHDGDDSLVDVWRVFFDERIKRRRWIIDVYARYIENLNKNGFPPIFDFQHLALLLGVERGFLGRIVQTPEQFYRTFEIPKRTGGMRRIDVPSPTLIHVQRWINQHILDKIQVHDACFSFVKGRSAILNARSHLDSRTLLKMDIKDFFPSIQMKRGMAIFYRSGYSRRVSYYLAKLCFYGNHLPQGASTSPNISNIVAKRFDARLHGAAQLINAKYTRYADDLTFSGDHISPSFIKFIRNILFDEGFEVNDRKTRLLEFGSSKIVTGVSISENKTKLPRKQVREIRKVAFYVLRYGLEDHSRRSGDLDPILLERLLGKIRYWLQVEPDNPTALTLIRKLSIYQRALDESL
jgi:RNA-directed DNA polymerase